MIGRGVSHSAVSVLNAIPCGIGAVIGTELETRAEFRPGGDALDVAIAGMDADPRLAEVCVARTMGALGRGEAVGSLRVWSEIPVSRGLKSSSAAANAIVEAVCASLGADRGRRWVLDMAVDCALEAGVTVTGAFDDACGCMYGGFVMTDNAGRSVLMARDLEPMDVLLHVPERGIEKSDPRVGRLRDAREEMMRIVEVARRDPLRALTLNGRLVAERMGLDDGVARLALDQGALAAGLSGTGPAVAILLPAGEGERFKERMGMDDMIVTRTRRQEHGADL